MDKQMERKYKRILEILPDVAECAQQKLILVGGTALAIFYLQHRISIDLDFVPFSGKDIELKEKLKGCLSKKGYRTSVGAYSNQFVINFEDTGVKVEVFQPEVMIKEFKKHPIKESEILVASLDEMLEMKMRTYEKRKEARDLYDIYCILKEKKADFGTLKELLKNGMPVNMGDLTGMVKEREYGIFKKAVDDASP